MANNCRPARWTKLAQANRLTVPTHMAMTCIMSITGWRVRKGKQSKDSLVVKNGLWKWQYRNTSKMPGHCHERRVDKETPRPGQQQHHDGMPRIHLRCYTGMHRFRIPCESKSPCNLSTRRLFLAHLANSSWAEMRSNSRRS